jgi:hypothetical protein
LIFSSKIFSKKKILISYLGVFQISLKLINLLIESFAITIAETAAHHLQFEIDQNETKDKEDTLMNIQSSLLPNTNSTIPPNPSQARPNPSKKVHRKDRASIQPRHLVSAIAVKNFKNYFHDELVGFDSHLHSYPQHQSPSRTLNQCFYTTD